MVSWSASHGCGGFDCCLLGSLLSCSGIKCSSVPLRQGVWLSLTLDPALFPPHTADPLGLISRHDGWVSGTTQVRWRHSHELCTHWPIYPLPSLCGFTIWPLFSCYPLGPLDLPRSQSSTEPELHLSGGHCPVQNPSQGCRSTPEIRAALGHPSLEPWPPPLNGHLRMDYRRLSNTQALCVRYHGRHILLSQDSQGPRGYPYLTNHHSPWLPAVASL